LRDLIMFNWIRKLKNCDIFNLDLKSTSGITVISCDKSYVDYKQKCLTELSEKIKGNN